MDNNENIKSLSEEFMEVSKELEKNPDDPELNMKWNLLANKVMEKFDTDVILTQINLQENLDRYSGYIEENSENLLLAKTDEERISLESDRNLIFDLAKSGVDLIMRNLKMIEKILYRRRN